MAVNVRLPAPVMRGAVVDVGFGLVLAVFEGDRRADADGPAMSHSYRR